MPQRDPRCQVPLAYADFLLALEAAGRAPGTLSYYRDKLGHFVGYLKRHGVTEIAAITSFHIRSYLVERQAEVDSQTVLHHAACVKAWLNHCIAEGLLIENVMRSVKVQRPEEKILVAFTAAEGQRIVKAAEPPRNRAVVLFLLDTGLRASEFVALDVGDVDLVTGAVTVRKTKTRRQRMVFLGAKTRRALGLYLAGRQTAPGDPLWLSNKEQRMTVNALICLLKRLARQTGIPHCHAHTFRRTFALWSLRAGMNVYVLQRLMGHADLSMLKRYLALTEQDLQAACRESGAVDRNL